MKPDHILPKGHGYWDLEVYPWGGSFHRATDDTGLVQTRVLDTYRDGAPRKVECHMIGEGDEIYGLIGVTLPLRPAKAKGKA